MADTQELETQAYLDLVKDLLNCDQGEEQKILATRPELVNESLVTALLAVAEAHSEEAEWESSVEWLVSFAQELAQLLGFDLEVDNAVADAQRSFLLEVLESIMRNGIKSEVTNSLLTQNLGFLNDEMILLLRDWGNYILAEVERDAQQSIAAAIGDFGLLMSNFLLGNEAVNIELSITCYEIIQEVFNINEHPELWAMTKNRLGIALIKRVRGDRAENLEHSIGYFELALKVYNQKYLSIDWSETMNSLGNAYVTRIRGDRAENLEKSFEYYKAALKIRTKADLPIEWASTQHNIGAFYNQRIKGDRAENLEQSIQYYQVALEVRTKADSPKYWAMTQNNLGYAVYQRIRDDRQENLEQSIEHYEAALEVRTKSDSPSDWAITQNNLAIAYLYREKGDRSENLEQTIVGFESVLEIYTRKDYPLSWATTQNNLANAYLDRIIGDRDKNLKHSIQCYEAALEVQTPQAIPIECLQTAQNLGNANFNYESWQKAIEAYETAMQAAETSRSWSVNDTERQRVLQKALSVYENAIQCAVNLKNYRSAIEYTERFRSRQLVELMASKDLYGDAQVPAEIQAYLTEHQQLNEDIDNLRESGDQTVSAAKTSRDSQALRADNEKISSLADRKQILYDKIRTHDPVLAGQIAITPISYNDIQKLITNAHTAILTCYSTNDNTHIFILKQNQEPELFTCTGQGYELQQWLIENWLIPYKQPDNSAWRDRMPLVLAEIADRLQLSQLIANHLSDTQELVLVPHLLLHQIPFAALPTGKSEELLGEKFTIRSIPSCQILKYCQDRSPILTSTQGIVEDADDSLLGARYEGQKIAEIHGVREIDRLRGKSQATISNYRQLLSRVNRLHSSHHASSNLENPLESALSLADGKITLGDLLMGEKYPNLDEIFLSACETHLGKFTFTDDVATLTTGFLCIGARSVQSTLWSVDDLVTAMFDIFYHEARRDLGRARSLQAAQKKLRNLTGEEFKIDRCPKLIEYVKADSSAKIAALKQRMKELHQQQSTLSNQTAEWQQIFTTMNDLSREVKSIESSTIAVVARLNRYGESDRPFESPFYWAGFICQGMA